MFGPLFFLWRYAGIPVYADLSLVILFGYVLLSDVGRLFDNLIVITLLFGSIALHEFGHSLTALRFRYHVEMIVLNVLGGAALIGATPRTALHEFLIAVAGPAVSVAVGVAGCFLASLFMVADMPGTAVLVRYVADLNFYLAVFNLLPAFPLDGGRVFRSILTPRMGLLRATEVAAWVGRAVAIFIGAYSVLWMLSEADIIRRFDPISIGRFAFTGSPIMLMIAVYIYFTAEMEYRTVLQEHYDNRFRWSNTEFREGDGDSWKKGPRDISKDVDVSPPPFDRDRDRYKGIRGFFRRLFRK